MKMKLVTLQFISMRKYRSNLRNELSNITSVFDPQDAERGLTVKFRDSEFPMGPGVFLQVNPGYGDQWFRK